MTKSEYKAAAAAIDAEHVPGYPPEPAVLTAYARAYRELDARRDAEAMAETKEEPPAAA